MFGLFERPTWFYKQWAIDADMVVWGLTKGEMEVVDEDLVLWGCSGVHDDVGEMEKLPNCLIGSSGTCTCTGMVYITVYYIVKTSTII
jgi:hypothetical protein